MAKPGSQVQTLPMGGIRPVLEPQKSESLQRPRHHLQKSLNGAALNCV
jgi:hypothetical protein